MGKKVFIETYGCQMNTADSEMIATILRQNSYDLVSTHKDADVILINTCSIRDNAEQRIYNRIAQLQHLRKKKKHLKIGVIGCMAERVGELLFEKEGFVNFLAGPDSYRNISDVIEESENKRITDLVLSHIESYEDIVPQKLLESGVSAFVPITRGCENFCTYCVVPYTRGRERSRSLDSIKTEIASHVESGIKEIILLGQNVNSYRHESQEKLEDFPDILGQLAEDFPNTRFRFSTSHPKDISDKLLHVIADHSNICRSVHLPMQSGSSEVLKRMNRKYTREWYLERIDAIRRIIPDCTISSDIIIGFCGETEDDFQQTLSTMKQAQFFYSFMFKYSERSGTVAAKSLKDDVSEEVKTRRLTETIKFQQKLSLQCNVNDKGKIFEVLVEDVSKRNKNELMGRTSQNKVVIFEANILDYPSGSFVNVEITEFSSATLHGKIVEI